PVKTPADADRTNRIGGILGSTFFPSSLESRNSPPVAVFADRDTENIDITLQARTLHSLAGTIVYGDGKKAVANAMVVLTPVRTTAAKPGIEGAMSYYVSATDKSGRWTIANVPDGNYHLRVDSARGGAELTQRFFANEQDVKVEGADVEDLLIEVSSGAHVSGTVIMEGDGAELALIDVSAARKGNVGSYAKLEGIGNFTLTSVPPGEVMLSAFPSPPEKFYVKSIEAKGMDLLHTNLNIAAGEELKDVRIVVSSAVGVVSGRVLSEKDNKPVKGITVMLRRIGEDPPRLFGGKLTSTTDENGNYLVSAGPGVYLVLAWRVSDGPAAFGAADKASRQQGAGLTLLPNDRKQLNLRVP
ncbi:MAG TPA: carboxypeptidase-like regulatory domain-containing protein, partial [Pyrinomonadaceae bacterium]|nr:carboxypeptidase-like regulatory domain-containing protein [Pyrinomonadaceae bacterium]